ncbi:hypothetical protein WG954_13745 [Lacibacter sp. H375]|uniref:hypothetical protein n=1 Tax=Lacibacter sp. H375 TaxID=3133424 RepID=UPI0030C5238F
MKIKELGNLILEGVAYISVLHAITMKSLLLIAILISVYSCTNSNSSMNSGNKFSLSNNITIDSKTYATNFKKDKSSEVDMIYCQSDSTTVNTIGNCIIQNSDTLKYLRRSTFLFDTVGQIQELLEYHPEGALHYSSNDLLLDTAIVSSWKINLKHINSIQIDAKNGYVIDNGDTLKIFDHWIKQKFIFVRATNLDKAKFDNPVLDYTIIYGYK